jgi:hypothetical protein
MAFTSMLPGQPIPLPRGPAPQLGGGIYLLDGQVRPALVGVPSYDGPVGIILRHVDSYSKAVTSHLDIVNYSCPPSPTSAEFHRPWNRDSFIASASNNFNFCRRQCSPPCRRGIHWCHPYPRCTGNRKGQSENWRVFSRRRRCKGTGGMFPSLEITTFSHFTFFRFLWEMPEVTTSQRHGMISV